MYRIWKDDGHRGVHRPIAGTYDTEAAALAAIPAVAGAYAADLNAREGRHVIVDGRLLKEADANGTMWVITAYSVLSDKTVEWCRANGYIR